jgi:hypothetical protein
LKSRANTVGRIAWVNKRKVYEIIIKIPGMQKLGKNKRRRKDIISYW